MVKHIYIFTLISICMSIWVRFIVFEKEYFCSSGRRIRCKWDVGNMCFTIVKRIVGMLSKQKRYSKFLFSTGFFYTPPYHAGIVFLLTPFHLSKESFPCKSSIRNKELREKSQQDLEFGYRFFIQLFFYSFKKLMWKRT